jgi:hypothetical protein
MQNAIDKNIVLHRHNHSTWYHTSRTYEFNYEFQEDARVPCERLINYNMCATDALVSARVKREKE